MFSIWVDVIKMNYLVIIFSLMQFKIKLWLVAQTQMWVKFGIIKYCPDLQAIAPAICKFNLLWELHYRLHHTSYLQRSS